MGDEIRSSPAPRGVGLSDPTQSANRRKILEGIDRMRATGYVTLGIQALRCILILFQSRGGYGFAHDRRHRFSKCRKVLVD